MKGCSVLVENYGYPLIAYISHRSLHIVCVSGHPTLVVTLLNWCRPFFAPFFLSLITKLGWSAIRKVILTLKNSVSNIYTQLYC